MHRQVCFGAVNKCLPWQSRKLVTHRKQSPPPPQVQTNVSLPKLQPAPAQKAVPRALTSSPQNSQQQQQQQQQPRGSAPALWVVCAYFNPCRYESRLQNYRIFAEHLMRQGVPLCTVELAESSQAQELLREPLATQANTARNYKNKLVSVHSKTVLWAKEALINIGAQNLPPECTVVCWADADLVWACDDWAERTVAVLSQPNGPVVVQPWDRGVHMEKGETYEATYKDQSDARGSRSFGKVYATLPEPTSLMRVLSPFEYHAGYAWAIRRDVFEQIGGLYEFCILGQADYMMAVAFTHNNTRDRQMDNSVNDNCSFGWSKDLLMHIRTWQQQAAAVVGGRLGYVPGLWVYHNWHGDHKNRGYLTRGRNLCDFDPATDLRKAANGTLEFTEAALARGLPKRVQEYFRNRKEDTVLA